MNFTTPVWDFTNTTEGETLSDTGKTPWSLYGVSVSMVKDIPNRTISDIVCSRRNLVGCSASMVSMMPYLFGYSASMKCEIDGIDMNNADIVRQVYSDDDTHIIQLTLGQGLFAMKLKKDDEVVCKVTISVDARSWMDSDTQCYWPSNTSFDDLQYSSSSEVTVALVVPRNPCILTRVNSWLMRKKFFLMGANSNKYMYYRRDSSAAWSVIVNVYDENTDQSQILRDLQFATSVLVVRSDAHPLPFEESPEIAHCCTRVCILEESPEKLDEVISDVVGTTPARRTSIYLKFEYRKYFWTTSHSVESFTDRILTGDAGNGWMVTTVPQSGDKICAYTLCPVSCLWLLTCMLDTISARYPTLVSISQVFPMDLLHLPKSAERDETLYCMEEDGAPPTADKRFSWYPGKNERTV